MLWCMMIIIKSSDPFQVKSEIFSDMDIYTLKGNEMIGDVMTRFGDRLGRESELRHFLCMLIYM